MVLPTAGPLAGPEEKGDKLAAAGLTCRLATVEELERVTAFSREAAGVDIPPQYWRWRYFDNPAGPSGIVIALDGERIVGSMSAFAVPFRLGGQRLLSSQLGENNILRSHRSTSVYFQLAVTVFRELLDRRGIDFCFGIAPKETRDLSVVLMEFDEVGPISKLVKIVNPVPHLRKKSKLPLPRSLGTPFAMGRRWAAGRALRDFTVARFDHFSEVDDGGRQQDHAGHVIASRDPSYMEWRYVSCPLRCYEKVQLRSGGELLGWVVYHVLEEQGVRYGVLDECFSSTQGGAGPVVDLAIGAFLERGVDAVVAWASPSTTLHRALRSRGFVPRPSPRWLIARPFTDRVPASVLSSEDSWYYTIGDTDYWLFPVRQGQREG